MSGTPRGRWRYEKRPKDELFDDPNDESTWFLYILLKRVFCGFCMFLYGYRMVLDLSVPRNASL